MLKRSRWYASIRWKLLLSYLVISVIPLLFFFNIMLASVKDYFNEDKKNTYLPTVNILAGNILRGKYLVDNPVNNEQFDLEMTSKSIEGMYRIIVVDSKGMVVSDSGKSYIGKILLIPEIITAFTSQNDFRLHSEENAVYVASVIENENKEKLGAVLIVADVEDIRLIISDIRNQLIIVTILIVGIEIILVLITSQLFIDPLKNMLRVIERITRGKLSERIETKGSGEFAELGDAFNKMTERLEQVEKIRDEFVSNVSHELKTPLSSIKILTESILLNESAPIEMYNEFLRDINSEIDRITDIVGDLLNLVRLDQHETGLNIVQADLNKMVSDVIKRLSPIAERKDVEIVYEDLRGVIIDADEMKLSLAISNLIDNGIKYTPGGGMVKVTVNADHQNAFVTVADSGIGISAEEQSKVFDRFYRVDKTRDRQTGGTGLGLAITQKAVLMHNGSIKLTSKENEGTTFVLRIPTKYVSRQV